MMPLFLILALPIVIVDSAWFVEAAAAEKPNIVLILSDDQAWTDYSFRGTNKLTRPTLIGWRVRARGSGEAMFPPRFVGRL